MKATRRRFLKTLAVGILGSGGISLPIDLFAKTNKYEDGIEIEKGFKVFGSETQKSMEALAETLLPGSKELGIKDMLMNYMAKNPGPAGFFDAGFWNLDTISKTRFKKPFYRLTSDEERKEIIEHVRSRNSRFFRGFRSLVIEFYYSHPEVWKRLSYNGPPQPRGFMDYSLPPKTSGK